MVPGKFTDSAGERPWPRPALCCWRYDVVCQCRSAVVLACDTAPGAVWCWSQQSVSSGYSCGSFSIFCRLFFNRLRSCVIIIPNLWKLLNKKFYLFHCIKYVIYQTIIQSRNSYFNNVQKCYGLLLPSIYCSFICPYNTIMCCILYSVYDTVLYNSNIMHTMLCIII